MKTLRQVAEQLSTKAVSLTAKMPDVRVIVLAYDLQDSSLRYILSSECPPTDWDAVAERLKQAAEELRSQQRTAL